MGKGLATSKQDHGFSAQRGGWLCSGERGKSCVREGNKKNPEVKNLIQEVKGAGRLTFAVCCCAVVAHTSIDTNYFLCLCVGVAPKSECRV